ncbi:hypothetical protein GW17_00008934 [Ensete ventricosum]|nr:hypothetical protein GW17_00008934 [Ensete ventricosum]
MHPLRFSDCGIRAKVFVRKISFKLYVMRLNRVESFYAFLLYVYGKRSEERGGWPRLGPLQGWPAMAKAPFRGDHQQARPLAGLAGACGRRQPPRASRWGRLQTARPQGAAPRPGLSPARAAASRGSARSRRRHCPTRCRPRAAAPTTRAAAHADNMQHRRLRRAMALEVTLSEILNMLREAESTIKKEKLVLYIGETKKKRKASKILKKGKGKERLGKAKVAKRDSTKDKGQCFHCGQDGHLKRNRKDYLAD